MLSDIPTEILAKILSFLPIKDVLHSSYVCQRFRTAAALVYRRRRNEIRGQYDSNRSVTAWNYSEVRNLLLSRYGRFVGLWKVVSTPYGGLVRVKFDGYHLIGIRYYPPPNPHIDQPLRSRKIFVIDVDNDGQFEFICLRGNGEPHRADISELESDGFQLDCKDSKHHEHPAGRAKDFEIWLCEELGLQKVTEDDETDLLSSKYDELTQEVLMKCCPLNLPPSREGAIIQPGLFKGTYSAHGLELVLLTYNDEDNSAVITKITGDSNVPAGKVTIMADLNSPIVDAEDTDPANSPDQVLESSSQSGLPLRRYKPPDHMVTEQVIPHCYLLRFNSNGQVAFTGYEDATFVPGHWVVFDEDTFGHAWLFLSAFAMFRRVSEKF